jgi:hypothetical protein
MSTLTGHSELEAISENVSENQRTRRGRPRRFPPLLEETMKSIGAIRGSRRSQLNGLWCLEAVGIMMKNPEPSFKWLFDEQANPEIYKRVILSELGRIEDEETMLAVMREVCRDKPTTRDAVLMIRRYRLGRSPEPNCLDLTRVILDAIKSYAATHPSISDQFVLAALENASDAWREYPSE